VKLHRFISGGKYQLVVSLYIYDHTWITFGLLFVKAFALWKVKTSGWDCLWNSSVFYICTVSTTHTVLIVLIFSPIFLKHLSKTALFQGARRT